MSRAFIDETIKRPITAAIILACAAFASSSSAVAADYAALYKQLVSDMKHCTIEGDPSARLKCFDKLVSILDLNQTLFPIKEPTPTPDIDPFDKSKYPTLPPPPGVRLQYPPGQE